MGVRLRPQPDRDWNILNNVIFAMRSLCNIFILLVFLSCGAKASTVTITVEGLVASKQKITFDTSKFKNLKEVLDHHKIKISRWANFVEHRRKKHRTRIPISLLPEVDVRAIRNGDLLLFTFSKRIAIKGGE